MGHGFRESGCKQAEPKCLFFKEMFPIFVCLGTLRVECKGCHDNASFFFLQIGGHVGPTHMLEATVNSSWAGSCLGALGVMGDSFFRDQGLHPLSLKQMTPESSLVWLEEVV